MDKTTINAQVVADSVDSRGNRLTSLLITFPRIILAEVNTHRMLSKNTSSSRAIPFKKMVEAVQENPFIPIAWQKEHTGMQGSEYFTNKKDIEANEKMWLHARDYAIQSAVAASRNFGITKQLCNRLLEPFMWTTMLITGSKESWDNFFELRNPVYELWDSETDVYEEDGNVVFKSREEVKQHFGNAKLAMYSRGDNLEDIVEKFVPDFTEEDWRYINKGQAEIHMMMLAESIYNAMNESTPRKLAPGQWHIPFYEQITDLLINELVDGEAAFILDEKIAKISVAMAAHTSYTVVGGEVVKSSKKWLELYDRLLSYDPPHSSPFEHCARAMSDEEYYLFNKGRASLSSWDKSPDELHFTNRERGWCGPYKGFMNYRYLLENNLT